MTDEEDLLDRLSLETTTWICPICERERSTSEGCCSIMEAESEEDHD